MSDPTGSQIPKRSGRHTPRKGGGSQPSIVLRLLLIAVTSWATWTSVSLLGHAIDTCLTSGSQDVGVVGPSPSLAPGLLAAPSASHGQEADTTPTTGTNECMAGDVTLWPTGVTVGDAPFDLLLVRLPWILATVLLWLIYRDRSVSEGAAPPRPIDTFTAGGWIGPAAIGSLVMFFVGTVLLVPTLL